MERASRHQEKGIIGAIAVGVETMGIWSWEKYFYSNGVDWV
jgi:hypothetical protein